MADRTPRNNETREEEVRDANDSWRPASVLPTPTPIDGYQFRWIRTAMMGNADIKNVSSRLREGWEPVEAKDHPELRVLADLDSRFEGGIEIGGLILCKAPVETVEKRKAYYDHKAQTQVASVDQTYLRENDPRMPLTKPQRKTHVTFGKGAGE